MHPQVSAAEPEEGCGLYAVLQCLAHDQVRDRQPHGHISAHSHHQPQRPPACAPRSGAYRRVRACARLLHERVSSHFLNVGSGCASVADGTAQNSAAQAPSAAFTGQQYRLDRHTVDKHVLAIISPCHTCPFGKRKTFQASLVEGSCAV